MTSLLSFADHCLDGSFAGVAEHTLLYPLDTAKTCWQSQVLNMAAGMAGGCGIFGGLAGDVAGAGAGWRCRISTRASCPSMVG